LHHSPFERSFFPEGTDKRGGTKLTGVKLPTPWNHIKAAMAYSRGIPLLVMVENGLKNEGLLEPGYDWYVQRIDLVPSALSSNEFNGVLSSWKSKLTKQKAPALSPTELTIGQLFNNLKPSQLWSIVVALAAIVSGAFWLGHFNTK
jgi:hypothetical protein